MADLKNRKLIYLKGFLFLLMGILSAGLLIIQYPNFQFVSLLAICIWAFCRFYYFTFYVITHYVDEDYKFSGLGSFIGYLIRKRRK